MISKRFFDLIVASFLLLATAPVSIIAVALVRLTSPGPVIYHSTRVGKDGRPFTMYKFRSMTVEQDGHQARVTHSGDLRITRAGRWLRRFKLDELPQLWNVVKGDMSLVGPRPEDPAYVRLYDDVQREVLSVRPGMTGPAVLAFRGEEALLARAPERLEEIYVTEIMPAKLALDLDYVKRRSFGTDVSLIIKTVREILREG